MNLIYLVNNHINNYEKNKIIVCQQLLDFLIKIHTRILQCMLIRIEKSLSNIKRVLYNLMKQTTQMGVINSC